MDIQLSRQTASSTEPHGDHAAPVAGRRATRLARAQAPDDGGPRRRCTAARVFDRGLGLTVDLDLCAPPGGMPRLCRRRVGEMPGTRGVWAARLRGRADSGAAAGTVRR